MMCKERLYDEIILKYLLKKISSNTFRTEHLLSGQTESLILKENPKKIPREFVFILLFFYIERKFEHATNDVEHNNIRITTIVYNI